MKGSIKANQNTVGLEGRPLSMYLVPGLLVAMVTILILAVLVHQVLSRGADEQADRTMTRAASLVSAALSTDVKARLDRLSFLASEPGLASWVARGMKPEDREVEVERLASWLPGVLQVRLLPADWQQIDADVSASPAPLGYAGIDMLRRVVKAGKPSPAEVHQADIGKPYIALAVPLWQGDKAVGALLAAYPADAMNALVRSFEPLPGAMALMQKAGERPYLLTEIGRTLSSDATHLEHVAGTIWQLQVQAAPQLAFGLALVEFLGFVALGLLPLALIFWLQLRTLARSLKHDLDGIAEQTQAFTEGRPVAQLHPRLRITAHLQKRVAKLLRDACATRNVSAAPAMPGAPPAPAAAPIELPSEVFRAYDIRGDAEALLSDDFARRLGLVLAAKIREASGNKAVVGRDVRLSSERLQQALIEGLIAGGCDVVDVGMAPTPEVYFAQKALNAAAAVVVTASHNPAKDNGFKIALGDAMLAGDDLAALQPLMSGQPAVAPTPGQLSQQMLAEAYREKVVADVQLLRPLKVVVDAGNGAAGPLAVSLFKAMGCEVIELFCQPDGNFPNHHPDPSQPENLSALMLEVQAQEADIGLAFDGDGDRLGVVDSEGQWIWPDRLLMLLAGDLLVRLPGSDILYDVKCSRHLGRFILANGGRPLMNASGHARMRARMEETGAPLGGEFSGHFFIRERWYGFDDAIYAAARVLEVLAADERSSAEQFADLPVSPATPEYHLHLGEGENVVLMKLLASKANFEDAELVRTDGLRVEFSDGWGLVRPSNTTPSLVYRFEADDDAALIRIQDRMRDWLAGVAPGVTPPF